MMASEHEITPQADAPGETQIVYELGELSRPIDLPKMFGRTARFELEIGFGSGIFLAIEAAARPDVNFLGIEHDRGQVYRTKDKLVRRGMHNVRLLCCDAPYFLEEGYIAPGSVETCHIYFSDPWPKKRHHKRRLFSPRLIPLLGRILAPGADLRIKTDVTEYYDVMEPLLSAAEFLKKEVDLRLDLEPLDGDIITNFQRKAMEKGHPIHMMVYRHIAPPTNPTSEPTP